MILKKTMIMTVLVVSVHHLTPHRSPLIPTSREMKHISDASQCLWACVGRRPLQRISRRSNLPRLHLRLPAQVPRSLRVHPSPQQLYRPRLRLRHSMLVTTRTTTYPASVRPRRLLPQPRALPRPAKKRTFVGSHYRSHASRRLQNHLLWPTTPLRQRHPYHRPRLQPCRCRLRVVFYPRRGSRVVVKLQLLLLPG